MVIIATGDQQLLSGVPSPLWNLQQKQRPQQQARKPSDAVEPDRQDTP